MLVWLLLLNYLFFRSNNIFLFFFGLGKIRSFNEECLVENELECYGKVYNDPIFNSYITILCTNACNESHFILNYHDHKFLCCSKFPFAKSNEIILKIFENETRIKYDLRTFGCEKAFTL
jgi:hypothetical protein